MRHRSDTCGGREDGSASDCDLAELLEAEPLEPEGPVGIEGHTRAYDVGESIQSEQSADLSRIPQPAESSALAPAYTPSGEQIRPWVRFWARMLDVILLLYAARFVLAFVPVPGLRISGLMFSMGLLIAFMFVEQAMLAGWGTTPGKALLKIRVRDADGCKLSYSDAFSRSLGVCCRGLGLGVPFVAPFTLLYANYRLTKRGATSWDDEGDFTVTHQIIGPWRTIAAVLFFAAFSLLVAAAGAQR